MKDYPSIDGPSKAPHKPCYGFVKYDGSNIRAEWSSKRGWYKFGTRKTMFDETDPIWGRCIPLFKQKYETDLEQIFKNDKQFRSIDNFTVFFEFFGTKSFAGMHFPDETAWETILFDVSPLRKGILGPKEFIDTFGHLKVAEHIFTGNMGTELIEGVKNGTINCESKYEIKTEIPEGMIVKGDKGHKLWMNKIKTNTYFEELKKRFELDWEKYWGSE